MLQCANKDVLYLSNVLEYLLKQGTMYPPRDAYSLHRAKKTIDREAKLIRESIREYISLRSERQRIIDEWKSQPEDKKSVAEINSKMIELEMKGRTIVEQAESFLAEEFRGKMPDTTITLDCIASGVVMDNSGEQKPVMLSLEQMDILSKTILE